MKRIFDLLFAALGLILSSPVLAVAAAAVKFDSPGPVIFRQERVGRHGRIFRILKIRSMAVDSEGPAIARLSDDRITRSGAWLRATKIDELPQLINVLAGDMSLVGPRPEVPKYVAMWDEDARAEILSVRPGISDPASIEYRRESELLARSVDQERHYVEEILPRKVELSRDYVQRQSMQEDLRILARTILAVVRH
jgi:lipopolysaccharide/colanic/teichoic acid biosynthesis glycosyltransferase